MIRAALQTCLTVMALLGSATFSSAADCISDPNECTLKKLCEASTTLDGSSTIWATTSETAKHVALAQSLGMECGITPIVDLCETDPSECKVSEICGKATTESAGQIGWNDSAAGHVALAKEYGLSCDVVVEAVADKENCSINPVKCGDVDLCFSASRLLPSRVRGSPGFKVWRDESDAAKEAKKRGLTCGVAQYVKTCSPENIGRCKDAELCKNATVPRGNSRTWKTFKSTYLTEAKKRGLSCGVKAKTTSVKKECSESSVEGCSEDYICKIATYKDFGSQKLRWWEVAARVMNSCMAKYGWTK